MNSIKIIYEDEDIMVIDKPSLITVNRSDTTKGELTIQDFVEERFKNNSAWLDADKESDFYQRAGIVHRIDKETSGILLVAKNIRSFEILQDQFKQRKVKKVYIALVHGHMLTREGEIIIPVGRLPWNRKRFGVLAGGKEASTSYRVLSTFRYAVSNKKFEDLSLLEVIPKTGRTHQIRVHLKYTNHPIFGDLLYAGRKTAREDRKILERVFLHAQKISFYHPKTGEWIEFESPLSDELQKVLKQVNH